MDTKTEIYLDNAATTKVDEDAAKLAYDVMTTFYGNPSSAHAKGLQAEHLLKKAQNRVLEAAGYTAKEAVVIFTSCGTEASNSAIFSVYKSLGKRKKNIVISDSEHPSVENAARELEKNGVKVFRIPTKGGKLDLDFASKVINADTMLISCMAVNNETGAIYDIKALDSLRKANARDALLHVDAVQGFTHLPFYMSAYNADFISLSSHKINAPKGAGALIVKKGVNFNPFIFGGGQQGTLRSGTENMPGICAFGLACEKAHKEKEERLKHLKALNSFARSHLKDSCPFVVFNTTEEGFARHILSVSIPGIRSEIMLRFLSEKGIYVSAGSACSSRNADNRVLTAFGLDNPIADSTLRISFDVNNTQNDIITLAQALNEGNDSLIHTLK